MANDEVSVATAALAIAISALVIACGQLLQQFFSAADGHRKCQNSVIGEWSRLVELPFRWSVVLGMNIAYSDPDGSRSSFRFEVRVTTPHFVIPERWNAPKHISFFRQPDKSWPLFPASLFASKQALLIDAHCPVALVNSSMSRQGTFCAGLRDTTEDQASWTWLLEDLHDLQAWTNLTTGEAPTEKLFETELRNRHELQRMVCIRRKTRSWDFMPPDVVRPVASTTLATLVIMAHRFGMEWSHFDPEEGKLRASGHGRSFSSSIIRGMGLVVEFTRYGTRSTSHRIISVYADMLSCGIIPFPEPSSAPHYSRRHLKEVSPAPFYSRRHSKEVLPDDFSFLKPGSEEYKFLEKRLNNTSRFSLDEIRHFPLLAAFTDIPSLQLPWLRLGRDSLAYKLDNPFPYDVTFMGDFVETRVVWRILLQREEDKNRSSNAQNRVLERLKEWARYSDSFYRTLNRYEMASPIYKAAFDEAESYFDALIRKNDNVFRSDLIEAHIKINCKPAEDANKIQSQQGHRWTPEGYRHDIKELNIAHVLNGDQGKVERALVYFKNISKVVDEVDLKRKGLHERSEIEDAWWMLMLRMLSWHMGHKFVTREDVLVPSKFYDDQRTVYIL